MIKRPNTKAQRIKRHKRVRAKISGTAARPRLSVYRSENNIYAQVIDDVAGHTLCSASSVEKGFEGGGNKEAAERVGKMIAERAIAKGIEETTIKSIQSIMVHLQIDLNKAMELLDIPSSEFSKYEKLIKKA